MKYSRHAVIASLTRRFGLPLFIAALLCAIGLPLSAQIPTKQLQFDFNDTGASTTDSVHQIVLDLRSKYGKDKAVLTDIEKYLDLSHYRAAMT